MEAEPATELPKGSLWQYEPKWDGFRCLAFCDGGRIKSFVLDGEIVIPVDGRLSFDKLLMRIHPAASRIQKLSRETPCVFIIFDLLVDDKSKSLVSLPLGKRRERLEAFMGRFGNGKGSLEISPVTDDVKEAVKWFHMGTGLDGIVAKQG